MRFLPLLILIGHAFAANTVSAERPNVLLIVSDDQGYNDLGVLNENILTPNLDRLAREGTRLTNFYVAWPACTPSRASLLTGRYPQRNGLYDMIRNEAPDYGKKYTPAEYDVTFERIGGIDLREVLLSELLQRAGYRTAIFGKWDFGTLKRFLPTSQGFDQFYGFANTGIDYFTHERYGVPSMYRNLTPTQEDRGIYATELFKREALRFLRERKDDDKPFFLYLPFNAPHGSSALDPSIRSTVQAPEEYRKLYPPVEQEYRTTEKYRYGNPAKVVTKEARRRDYSAAVTCMDHAIGEVLNLLESRGILDETIVIFLSDNGGGGGADNAPLRGRKAQMWEGGIRVPCIVRWPEGDIPHGSVSDAFLTSLEIFPGVLSATGTKPPEGVIVDGFDWWSTLRKEAPSPRTEMFWKRQDDVAARVGEWKWSRIAGKERLFHLKTDIGEQTDLAESHPEKLQQLRAAFGRWNEQMEAAEPRGPFRDY